MGMFDYVRCAYPLPVEGANDLEYQTKDTDAQWMDYYEIREDGTLWHQEYDTEDHSDPNAEGFERFCGCMTRVNERWVRESYTGPLTFYTGTPNGWLEFSALFASGLLVALVVASHTRSEV
jgi:hypothetical protein